MIKATMDNRITLLEKFIFENSTGNIKTDIPLIIAQEMVFIARPHLTNITSFTEIKGELKPHLGQCVQYRLQDYWKIENGKKLDYNICGMEVDLKTTAPIVSRSAWCIQNACVGHPLILIHTNTSTNYVKMGLTIADPEYLRHHNKKGEIYYLNQKGIDKIYWLFENAPLPSFEYVMSMPEQSLPNSIKLKYISKREKPRILVKDFF